MTPRLTTPQLAVLRALDALPEGDWITAKEGGFSTRSAMILIGIGRVTWRLSPTKPAQRTSNWSYKLTYEGRALVAQFKAEGKL